MVDIKNKNIGRFIILFLIIALSIIAFWIRYLPASQLIGNNSYILGQEPDISYNLRLIELMDANFPKYPSFDAMTYYPYGSVVGWGPIFTSIITSLVILMGATTRPEIAAIAFIVPPTLAALMVPLMYAIGRTLADWKTGIISALFVTVVPGQYLYRSLYGFADHHIAEVFLSTLFCLTYIVALYYTQKNLVKFNEFDTLKIPLILVIISGFAYFLGLLTMGTMVLFALIVAIFTFIQFIWNHMTNRSSDYLVFINTGVFGLAIIGLLVYGFRGEGFNFVFLTPAHLFAYLGLIFGTFILWIISHSLKNYSQTHAIALGVGILIVVILLVTFASQLIGSFFGQLSSFIGTWPNTLTIQEARPWTIAEAWTTYQFGLILAIGGFIALLYKNIKDERPDHIFVFIWALVMFISASQHVRYDYYLGPIIALLASLSVGSALSLTWGDVENFIFRHKFKLSNDEASKNQQKKKGKPEKKKVAKKKAYDPLMVFSFILVTVFALLFIGASVNMDYQVSAFSGYNIMHPDWRETLEWMENHTPDPGVDYYRLYDKTTFSYPEQSYGVMSWWDYGHWITFFGKRIPHANPFQSGVSGMNGSASFFMSPTENQTMAIANNLGTKYVITDIEMDTGKFWAMATWYNEQLAGSPYQEAYLITSPENPTTYERAGLFTQDYYLTTVSRLHNFDGSMTDPSLVYYIEYIDGSAGTSYYPVITRAEQKNITQALSMEQDYNKGAPAGYHATVLSASILNPLTRVPALKHFRLIHESPTNVFSRGADVRYVKAFEYVKGAHIKGEGIIEVSLITNTGRNFIYRQESSNGEFIVPYPTEGNLYDVKATGKYQIMGTNLTFSVIEDAVQKGLVVT